MGMLDKTSFNTDSITVAFFTALRDAKKRKDRASMKFTIKMINGFLIPTYRIKFDRSKNLKDILKITTSVRCKTCEVYTEITKDEKMIKNEESMPTGGFAEPKKETSNVKCQWCAREIRYNPNKVIKSYVFPKNHLEWETLPPSSKLPFWMWVDLVCPILMDRLRLQLST